MDRLDDALTTACQKILELEAENRRMRSAMKEFVMRCEDGAIRSKYTYGLFKAILEAKSNG